MLQKIQFFSKKTNNFYQLFPTKTIPTLRINGVPMHRYIKIDPLVDTKSKIAALKPNGTVLDTCTGLGYTSIYSAKSPEVNEVITFERDPEVLKITKMNESSNDLFTDKKIKIINKDVSLGIKELDDSTFDCIMHDPPTFTISPVLYELKFYKELYRVLKNNGRLWHYAPTPGKAKSQSKANNFVLVIINKLKEAGFKKIFHDEKSSGIIARK